MNRMLATSGNEVKIWDFENFNLVNEYQFLKPINWFSVKQDTHIASVTNEEAINIINLQTDDIQTFKDVEAKCCCYDSFGKNLTVGLKNGCIDVYEFKLNNVKKRTHKVHNHIINCIAYSKQDRFIASGTLHGTIVLFNTNTNQLSKPLYIANKTSSVTSLQCSAYNLTNLASSYDDGTVIYWDTLKEKPICTFNKHVAPATCCILSSINEILMLSGGLDNTLSCYDTRAKKHIKSISIGGGITSLDMHNDGYTLAIGTTSGSVQIHDLRSKIEEHLHAYQAHTNTSLNCLKFIYQSTSQKLDETKTTTTTGMKKSNSTHETLSSIGGNSNLMLTNDTINNPRILINKSNSIINVNATTTDRPKSESTQIALNIFSPECIRNDSIKQQQQQLQSSSSSSFVLHKNSLNTITPIANNNNTSNNNSSNTLNATTPTIATPSSTSNGSSANITKINLLISNKGHTNGLQAELYSPLVSHISSSSSLNNNNNNNINQQNNGINSPYYDANSLKAQNHISNSSTSSMSSSNGLTSSATSSSTNLNQNNLINEQFTPLRSTTLSSSSSSAIATPVNSSGSARAVNTNNKTVNEATSSSTTTTTTNSAAANNNPNISLSFINSMLNTNDSTIANINAHAASLPIEQIKEIVKDSIDELRDEFMNENFKFKAEILKEFMLIRQEIQNSFKMCSVNEALVAEILRLKEENKRLKKLF